MIHPRFFTVAIAAMLLLAGRESGRAQSTVVTTLYDFPSGNLRNPNGLLIQARDGNFYGLTYAYPTNGDSSFYVLTPAGKVGLRHVFNFDVEGSDPTSLIQGSDGNFYGTTFQGGANNRGTVFQLTAAGALTVLHTFTDAEGDEPGSLIQANDGNFYVAVTGAGIEGGLIYRLTPKGMLSLVHHFTSAEGQQPFSLLQATDGDLYGLTSYGGTNGGGTVFKLTPAGVLTTLYAFGANVAVGTEPGGLFQASDGDLYGFAGAGSYNGGTIFKLPTTGGTPAVLHGFHGHNTNGDGADPSVLIQAADGNFYGANVRSGLDDADAGSLFVVTPAGEFATFYDFPTSDDYCDPNALVQASSGNLFGATFQGGASIGGTLFELAFPTGGVFQFSAATYSARETAANVAVQVARVGDTAGAATVQYATTDGTAQAGIDYVAASGTLSWAAGDSAPKTVTVQLRYPGVMYSGDPRTFSLGLSAPTGGAVTGTVDTTTVNIVGTGNPPIITSALTASADAGTPFSYQITAANSPATYGVSGLPDGLTVNAHTGLISGTPKYLGTFSLTLHADSGGGVGSATLTLTVQPAGSPLISSAPTASGAVGAAFSYQIVSGGNATAYGVQGLPGGLKINASTGLISGTPTLDGTYTLMLHAYNNVGKGSAVLTLTVQKQGTPLITSASTASGKVGAAFSYQIVAGSNLSSYGVESLPGGLTVDARSGLISGAPKFAGVSTLTLHAYNAAGKGSATLTLTITP